MKKLIILFSLLSLNIFAQEDYIRILPEQFSKEDSLFFKTHTDTLGIDFHTMEYIPPFDIIYEDLSSNFFVREIIVEPETEYFAGHVEDRSNNNEKTKLNKYYAYFIEEFGGHRTLYLFIF